MIDCKVLYLILASTNPEHALDERIQRETWANENQSNVIWLRGGTETQFNSQTRTLTVDIAEDYKNILKKTQLGVKWCLENTRYKYLIRGNVSTYFNQDKVAVIFENIEQDKPIVGGYYEFLNQRNLPLRDRMFINGGAIFMNYQSSVVLSRIDSNQWIGIPDDYALSRFLVARGALTINIPRGNVGSTGIITNRAYFRLKSSSNWEMASIRMSILHQIVASKSLKVKLRSCINFYYNEILYFKNNHSTISLFLLSIYSVVSNAFKSRILLKFGK